MRRSRPRRLVAAALAPITAAMAVMIGLAGCQTSPPKQVSSDAGVITAVASINAWGSILSQLGGTRVMTTSIITNPNTDPHDYEPTPADGRVIADAAVVVENGVGYDTWAAKTVAATGRPGQLVIDVGRVVGVPDGGNPHRWYSPPDVERVADAITADLIHADPRDAAYFTARRHAFEVRALAAYHHLIARIRARYAGTPVGASESIFGPMAQALGLDLITPPAFLKAISEGTDPSARDKTTIDAQLGGRKMKVYVLNRQNETPDVAAQAREAARARHSSDGGDRDAVAGRGQLPGLASGAATVTCRGAGPGHRTMTMPGTNNLASTEPGEQSTGDVVVRLDRAAARAGGRMIWSDVTLSVRAGEFVAVLGPNGTGKSTLLKTILGLHPVAAGQIDVLGARPGHANSRIGYLPQRRAFDPSTRIRGLDVVRLGWDGDRWGIPLPGRLGGRRAREATERVERVVALVGAEHYAGRPIGQCSGGEQQRLLIAQALIRDPDLLVLDEPLDSLDVTNQASVSALIQQVCRTRRVAVLLVAHDVNPILPYLDQVIYLARGGAVMGPPSKVITAETLTMLYGTPIDVLHDRAGRLVVVGQPDVHAGHR